jgi:c-di-GMP-binding flagellar brake protein YcgR
MVAVFNLSAGGISFYTRTNLEVGTILDLKIGFSRSHPSIICVGKVVRVTKHPVTSINGYAVEFTEIDEQIKKRINKSIEMTERQQKL